MYIGRTHQVDLNILFIIGDAGATSQADNSCHMLLIHGGMDTQGEIFDDCLVIRLD